MGQLSKMKSFLTFSTIFLVRSGYVSELFPLILTIIKKKQKLDIVKVIDSYKLLLDEALTK